MPSPYTRPTLAVDMDHVMADTGAYLCDWVNARFGTDHAGESFGTLREVLPDAQRVAMVEHVTEGTLMRDLPVMESCQNALEALRDRLHVIVCTAAMEYPNTMHPKLDWLAEHFPWIETQDIVFCGHKQVMGTDYLIDDSPKHFPGFAGTPLLYTAPHNVDVGGYTRVDDWDAVLAYFTGDR